MGLFVAVILFTWLLSKAVSDARLDHSYARQGLVSPRLQAKYGSRDRAAAMVAQYGFFDHLRDAWRDYWPRRTEALIAARDVRPSEGGRVRLRDRLAAGRASITAYLTDQPVPTSVPVTEPATTVGRPSVETPTAVDDPAAPTSTPPTAAGPEPAEPQPATPEPSPTVGAATGSESAVPALTHGGTAMSATGEAVNYETAIATIDDMIADVRGQIDSAQAALEKMAEAKAAVDALQQTYQPTAEAAGTKLDHEAALGLDATTLGHAGTTVDALPPNAVDGLYDQVEQIEQLTNERLVQAEIALSSLEAERAHLVATYGDAHATVAGNLGGDSRFLDSGGPAMASASPGVPAAAAI